MVTFLGFLSLAALLVASLFLTRMTRPCGRVEFLLTGAFALALLTFCAGWGASLVTAYGSPVAWTVMCLLLLALVAVPALAFPGPRRICLQTFAGLADVEQRLRAVSLRDFSARVLLALALVTGLVALINLAFILSFEPATQDALVTHLTRVAYYLQQGHLGWYPANRWEQIAYPKLSVVLFTFAYLFSGKMAGTTALVQYAAYFVSMLAVYGITRLLGNTRRGSAFAALIFGLLTISIVEAASVLTDMLVTAFIGGVLYYLLAYRERRQPKYLALAMIALVLAASVKITFVEAIPALLLVAACLLVPFYRAKAVPPGRHLGLALAALAAAMLLIAGPAGYWDNLQRYGDPVGPKVERSELTNEQRSLAEMLGTGGLNVLRYGVDSLRLDGAWPLPGVRTVSRGLIAVPQALFTRLGIDLTSMAGTRPFTRYGFKYHRPDFSQQYDDAEVSWGVLGLLLLWPALFITLVHRRAAPGHRVFAFAGLLYLFTLSATILYDQFHGRFLTTGALFVAPVLAPWLTAPRNRLARGYLVLVVCIGCVSALTTALFHNQTYFVACRLDGKAHPSTFSLSPDEQRIRIIPTSLLPRYNFFVEPGVTVALDTPNAPEFLFFGLDLSHRLLPVHYLGKEIGSLPGEAGYLLFDGRCQEVQAGDVKLFGTPPEAYYLRPLSARAREYMAKQQQVLDRYQHESGPPNQGE